MNCTDCGNQVDDDHDTWECLQTILAQREALRALLDWLLTPGFPIRWAASDNMAFFVLQHLPAFTAEYALCHDVPKAARAVREKVQAEEVWP